MGRGVPNPRQLEADHLTADGLALCKIHHAAYDGSIIGIRPDLRIKVARSVLSESNGPMLRHGLQGFHGQ